MEWGDRHLAPDGGPVRLRHRDCGAQVHVGMHCNAGRGVDADDIDVVPGPALDAKDFDSTPTRASPSARHPLADFR
jgi:hypothetical protein